MPNPNNKASAEDILVQSTRVKASTALGFQLFILSWIIKLLD